MLVVYRVAGSSGLSGLCRRRHGRAIRARGSSASRSPLLCRPKGGRAAHGPPEGRGGAIQALPMAASSIPCPDDGDMLNPGVDRPAGRHAGPALPASTSTSSLVQRGSAAMIKPLTGDLATELAP
jgi:hypothetical protein